jgi:quinol monooxygenase YgiN
MTENIVRVHVTFKLPSIENAKAFTALFRDEFIGRTRKEEGCLLYDIWVSNADPLTVVLIESWSSQQALDAHLAQDWLKARLVTAKELMGANNEPAFHFCKSVMD